MTEASNAVHELLRETVARHGSDLHIGADGALIRIYGELCPAESPAPSQREIAGWLDAVLTP